MSYIFLKGILKAAFKSRKFWTISCSGFTRLCILWPFLLLVSELLQVIIDFIGPESENTGKISDLSPRFFLCATETHLIHLLTNASFFSL